MTVARGLHLLAMFASIAVAPHEVEEEIHQGSMTCQDLFTCRILESVELNPDSAKFDRLLIGIRQEDDLTGQTSVLNLFVQNLQMQGGAPVRLKGRGHVLLVNQQ